MHAVRKPWVVGAALLLTVACGGTPAPGSTSSGGTQQNAGRVEFVSSQGQPAQEVQDMNGKVLAGFSGTVDFSSQPTESQDIDKVLAEHLAGQGTIDLLGLTHGGFASLSPADTLTDLTPLLQRLGKDRSFPQALLNYGKLGTSKQYYIPWMQATYVMVVNKKALPYLPKGANVNALTYDQLIAWGQAIQKATGEKLIGLPAAPGTKGGLLHRFLQGYAYPSYTGTEITNFKSPDAVQMWQMLKRLWAVTNPQSTTYAYMQDPLESGEVWVAWDHQARFQDALDKMGDQFQVVPAPAGPRGLGYMSVITGLAIPKNAPNRAGAEQLLDWLTRPKQQITTGATLGFFPTVEGVNLSGSGVPGYLASESAASGRYLADKKGIPALLEVGLGSQGDAFHLAYQDLFTRIVLRDQDITSSLDYEAGQIQQALNTAKAVCWPPDPPSTGPCQIK
ncbi:MAG TPA: ABC transporter substrate-binding protein [Candidatus Dormibacteraeota bacterium]|nr:ABC transporter substrate-binding protein [Candidatus Dormibacteraeota bacterium]